MHTCLRVRRQVRKLPNSLLLLQVLEESFVSQQHVRRLVWLLMVVLLILVVLVGREALGQMKLLSLQA